MNKWILTTLTIGFVALAQVGCRHCCFRPRTYTAPATVPVGGTPPVAFPGAVPSSPSLPAPPQPAYSSPVQPMPSQPYVPQDSYLGPNAPSTPDSNWQVPKSPKQQIDLGSPEPMNPPSTPKQDDPLLNTPPTPPKDQNGLGGPPSPPAGKVPSGSPLPVGIAQFAVAIPQKVTNGLRPMLDGLDWLESHQYKAVLHLHSPGEDDSSDRKQAEKRGMDYYSLEVSTIALNEKTIQDFADIVSDSSRHPLFVYDKDGSLAGGLWYLYFREMEQLDEETARVRANALGLRTDGDGTHREMWLAIQKYLRDKSP